MEEDLSFRLINMFETKTSQIWAKHSICCWANHLDKEGVVKQIYRGIIFMYDQNDMQDNAYFCAKSQSCERVKHDISCLGKIYHPHLKLLFHPKNHGGLKNRTGTLIVESRKVDLLLGKA